MSAAWLSGVACTLFNGTNGIPSYSTSYAFMGEHQWRINEEWTSFFTARMDKHTYTEQLFSPLGDVLHVWD